MREHHEALAPVGEPGDRLEERRLAHRGDEHPLLAVDLVADIVHVQEVVVGAQLLLLLQHLRRLAAPQALHGQRKHITTMGKI